MITVVCVCGNQSPKIFPFGHTHALAALRLEPTITFEQLPKMILLISWFALHPTLHSVTNVKLKRVLPRALETGPEEDLNCRDDPRGPEHRKKVNGKRPDSKPHKRRCKTGRFAP